MKPRLLHRIHEPEQQFVIRKNHSKNFLKIWHYHPELELVVVTESTGTRFVGDSIEKFEPGEVILIGKNLPHMWLNDDAYFQQNSSLTATAYAVHFNEHFLGEKFFTLNISAPISSLINKARRGIRFADLQFPIISEMEQLVKEEDRFSQMLKFLSILNKLAKHKNQLVLSSEGYINVKLPAETDKTQEFIFENFKNPIQLSDVAAVAEMNTSAFSRYFKRIHQKTFSRYLIEIRIGYACKLLMGDDKNISTVCYDSGFNNLSNFNKQFRKVKGMSPSEFIKKHR